MGSPVDWTAYLPPQCIIGYARKVAPAIPIRHQKSQPIFESNSRVVDEGAWWAHNRILVVVNVAIVLVLLVALDTLIWNNNDVGKQTNA